LLTQEGLSKNILPLLAILHKDPIANVRMNAAKGLGNVLNALKDKTIEVRKFWLEPHHLFVHPIRKKSSKKCSIF
jgi:hypothetical protein